MAVSTITITSGASTLIPTVEPVVLTLGTVGPQGAAGEGVPAGGTTGQILQKDSATNYDTSWIDNYTTDVRKYVKNDSGGTLTKGTVVYISGANGTNVLVKPALATTDGTSATTIGILNETLASNASGYAIVSGTVTGIDTSAANAGDPVWLSGTVAGGMLYGVSNKPVAPIHIVYLGTVTRANINQGAIEIAVNNGWELDELHNVKITSPTNGQVLTYQSSTDLWINSSETGDISAVNVTSPITGGGTSGAVTIGIDQTALTIAESQVTNLVTDLAGKVPTSRTITPATGITGGGDLSANRTIGLDNTVVSYDAASSLRSLPLYNQKDAAEKLLAQAVFWIDAAHSSASGQTITNLGWGGSTLNATAGSTGSADSNDPKFLDWTGTNYIYLPGAVNNNYLSVPDANNLDITGDIDVRFYGTADTWAPAGPLILSSKRASGQYSWQFYLVAGGYLGFIWSADGTATNNKTSSVAVPFSAGAAGWVRAILDVDNGASGNDVKFYTSTDGTNWTQLGTTITTAGTTSIFSGTSPVEIGSAAGGTVVQWAGNCYAAQVLNGIGGTTVLNVDTSVITSGAATSFTALTGQTVTINRATSGRKTCVVTNPLWLFGTDDYISAPDNDLLDFTATESFTALWIGRQWATAASYGTLISKRQLTPPTGYTIRNNVATLQNSSLVWDGTTVVTDTGVAAYTSGTFTLQGMLVDRSANLVKAVVNSTIATGTSIAAVGSLANTGTLQIGSLNGASYADMETFGAVVFRRLLTSAEITLLTNYYTTRVA